MGEMVREPIGIKYQKGEHKEYNELFLTPDFAWILGVLAAGGNVKKNGAITLSSKEFGLISKFADTGEAVFGLPAICHTVEPKFRDGKQIRPIQHQVSFNNIGLVEELGDFAGDDWAKKLGEGEKYHWIIQNPETAWAFLNGFYDINGTVTTTVSKGKTFFSVNFGLSSEEVFNAISDLLDRVWIVDCARASRFNGQIRGLSVKKYNGRVILAENLKPAIPEKTAKLLKMEEAFSTVSMPHVDRVNRRSNGNKLVVEDDQLKTVVLSEYTELLKTEYVAMWGEEMFNETAAEMISRFDMGVRIRDHVIIASVVGRGIYQINILKNELRLLKPHYPKSSETRTELEANIKRIENAESYYELRGILDNLEKLDREGKIGLG